jgi:bacillithiol system protein YtxJ
LFKSVQSADQVLEESAGRRVMVFKHSSACPSSAYAKREMEKFLAAQGDIDTYLVVVQDQRRISNDLAEKLGVRHESPQLIVIKDGRAENAISHG